MLQVAQVVPCTEAEGPGKRFAIWLQGCSIRCPGCCNPEMFSPSGGRGVEVAELAKRIIGTPGIEGITLLGGEPFEQAAAAGELCGRLADSRLSVMVFTGYVLADLAARGDPAIQRLLGAIDLLVDGRFERELPETRRRWIGSSNQVMHFLTDRHQPDDPRFLQPNSAEIHRIDGEWIINGWPALADRLRP